MWNISRRMDDFYDNLILVHFNFMGFKNETRLDMENILKEGTFLDKSFEKDFPNERPDTYMETIYLKGCVAGLNELKKYFEEQRLIAEINNEKHSNHYTVYIRKIDELIRAQA